MGFIIYDFSKVICLGKINMILHYTCCFSKIYFSQLYKMPSLRRDLYFGVSELDVSPVEGSVEGHHCEYFDNQII